MTPTRQQLEDAARACGLRVSWFDAWGALFVIAGDEPHEWKPHLDFAQCFYVETACRLNVEWDHTGSITSFRLHPLGYVEIQQDFTNHSNDPSLARMYASTMVAAEIGKRMREESK